MSKDYTAILEQLTGASRGLATRIEEDEVFAVLHADRTLRFAGATELADEGEILALLTRTETDYAISRIGNQDFWINKRLTEAANLRDGDMIEFGETGPMVRYHRFAGSLPLRWTVGEMASDTLAYLRFSRKPLGYRLRHAALQFGGRLIWQTTVAYRITVLVAIAALAGLLYSQYEADLLIKERIETGSGQLDSVAAALSKAREEALKPRDLAELRREFESRLSSNVERLAELERHSDAIKRVIRDATGSVAFLQMEFSLRDSVTGKDMRHVVNEFGMPRMLPSGQPFLSLDGNGPVATIQLTGTGFLLRDGRLIATNRHVALPWERGRFSGAISAEVLEPVITRFIAYFPDHTEPVRVSLVRASPTADLALLTLGDKLTDVQGIDLTDAPPVPGEEVILLGYPTGLRSLLAQSGNEFVQRLEADREIDFWNVSRRLSEAGLVVPLASRGIIAQVASEALVYDAETAVGGSGGPVLNLRGEVIAINAAILPEFGGSNLGVPVVKLHTLLAEDIGGLEIPPSAD